MQIKGKGTVSADRASMDIHLEITTTNVSRPAASQPVLSAPPVILKAKRQPAFQAPESFINKRVFGIETGKTAGSTHVQTAVLLSKHCLSSQLSSLIL